jgi:hypothetical protein
MRKLVLGVRVTRCRGKCSARLDVPPAYKIRYPYGGSGQYQLLLLCTMGKASTNCYGRDGDEPAGERSSAHRIEQLGAITRPACIAFLTRDWPTPGDVSKLLSVRPGALLRLY